MKLIVLLATIAVLVIIYLLEDKSKYWTGIAATLPLKVFAVMLMVAVGSLSPKADVTEVNSAMLIGMIATFAFVLFTSLSLKQGFYFVPSLGIGAMAWAAIVIVGRG